MEPRCSKRFTDDRHQVFVSLHEYDSLKRIGVQDIKNISCIVLKNMYRQTIVSEMPASSSHPCSSAASGSGIGVLMGVA
jgi:hypothetical protein